MMLAFMSPGILAPHAANWVFDFQFGYAHEVDSPLLIQQNAQPDIKVTAQWDTQSFTMPPYWSMRMGAWTDDATTAWEMELIHLKVYLRNLPPGVQSFNISHGQNMLFLNRSWRRGDFVLRAGAGLTISHPETEIRGLTEDGNSGFGGLGYQLSGGALQASGQYSLPLSETFSLISEVKLIGSYSVVRLKEGSADVPLFGVHALAGAEIHF